MADINIERGSVIGQKTEKAIIIVAIVLSFFLLGKGIAEWKAIPNIGRDVQANSTISVSGKGESFVVPDIANFSFTVQEESLVVSTAQNAATVKTKVIVEYLKKSGVAEKDIKTTGYNIYPRYEYARQAVPSMYPYPSDGKQTLAAYVVSQSIEVKVRKIEDSGKLIGGVGGLGATQISGLTFTVDDEDKVLNDTRTKAIADARQKAKELAKELGVSLVRIISYSDSGNYPMYYAKTMAAGMGGDSMSSAPTPEIPSGENKYVSNVTITYEIR